MSILSKALWFIESRLNEELSLGEIAQVAGVSQFHLIRAFGVCLGTSVVQYVRERRLSEAAKRLVAGEESILNLALDSGYNSHEAFTRAFSRQFSMSPETMRKQSNLDGISLTDPVRLKEFNAMTLDEPETRASKKRHFVGLSRRYQPGKLAAIPNQWQEFVTRMDEIDDAIAEYRYGICTNFDAEGAMDYCTAVETSHKIIPPGGFSNISTDEQTYAVFLHEGHVSSIGSAWNYIWSTWRPNTDLEIVHAPLFERYGNAFDRTSGNGTIEIWIPVKTTT